MLVDGCASDHRWRPRARGYGSKSAAFSACLTPRHHQHTHSHGTTLPTPHLITRHHTQPSTTATSCHSCFAQSLPFPLWYHLVEDQNYTKLWLGHFLPSRHFPSVNTFSAWSPCKEGQERGGLRADEGNCWSFTEC